MYSNQILKKMKRVKDRGRDNIKGVDFLIKGASFDFEGANGAVSFSNILTC
jgi:hypothetical protein